MKSKKSDYLKYWRTVRHYVKVKYEIGTMELELLLFLYSEPYFTRDKFEEFNKLLSWDKQRFKKLLHDGWIESMRNVYIGRAHKYIVTTKTIKMISHIYNILDGDEIPVTEGKNPMFARNVGFNDKVYRHFIMNLRKQGASKRLQQRLDPE